MRGPSRSGPSPVDPDGCGRGPARPAMADATQKRPDVATAEAKHFHLAIPLFTSELFVIP